MGERRYHTPKVVGSSPTAPTKIIRGRSQTGKALVLQTSQCGFESHRLHQLHRDVG